MHMCIQLTHACSPGASEASVAAAADALDGEPGSSIVDAGDTAAAGGGSSGADDAVIAPGSHPSHHPLASPFLSSLAGADGGAAVGSGASTVDGVGGGGGGGGSLADGLTDRGYARRFTSEMGEVNAMRPSSHPSANCILITHECFTSEMGEVLVPEPITFRSELHTTVLRH